MKSPIFQKKKHPRNGSNRDGTGRWRVLCWESTWQEGEALQLSKHEEWFLGWGVWLRITNHKLISGGAWRQNRISAEMVQLPRGGKHLGTWREPGLSWPDPGLWDGVLQQEGDEEDRHEGCKKVSEEAKRLRQGVWAGQDYWGDRQIWRTDVPYQLEGHFDDASLFCCW